MTIEEILAGESKNVEFKENLPEKSIKYMKSVVAFANGTGGKIIFGIADKTREVVGFDKEDVFKKMDAIANAVSDSCEPAIIPDVGGFGADCTAELLCRWVQVGAFSPLFRNHSSNGSIYHVLHHFLRHAQGVL